MFITQVPPEFSRLHTKKVRRYVFRSPALDLEVMKGNNSELVDDHIHF